MSEPTTATDAATGPAAAVFRPGTGTIRLSRHHLDELARAVRDGAPSPTRQALGLTGEDGGGPAAHGLATAWATACATVLVTRVGCGRRRAVEVRWGPGGTLALPVAPPATPVPVALTPPTALAASLWRLLRLGPRRRHATGHGPLDPAALTAPFDEHAPAPWLRALTPASAQAVLSRLELYPAPGAAPVALGWLDDGERLWQTTRDDGDRVALEPGEPLTALRGLCGWQERLLVHHAGLADPSGAAPRGADPASTEPPDPEASRLEPVPIGEGELTVPVPATWSAQPWPGRPETGVRAVWRQPTDDTAATLTVAVAPGAPGDPASLAAQLPQGRWIDAPAPDTAVLLHRGPTTDVVTVQRRVPLPTGCASASYTCPAHQARLRLPQLTALAAQVAVARPSERRSADAGSG